MAGGPCEHRRRPNAELEQVLFLTRRRQSYIGALIGELLRQPVADPRAARRGWRPWSGRRHVRCRQGKRGHRITSVAVQVLLLGRGDDEGVQPGGGEQRPHRMQPWLPIGARGREGQANTEVIQQISSAAGGSGCWSLKSLHKFTPGEPGNFAQICQRHRARMLVTTSSKREALGVPDHAVDEGSQRSLAVSADRGRAGREQVSTGAETIF